MIDHQDLTRRSFALFGQPARFEPPDGGDAREIKVRPARDEKPQAFGRTSFAASPERGAEPDAVEVSREDLPEPIEGGQLLYQGKRFDVGRPEAAGRYGLKWRLPLRLVEEA